MRPETALYGYVYVGLIKTTKRLKIGITGKEPERRRRAIEHASGLVFDDFYAVLMYNPGGCERYLLRKFGRYRADRGEWLELPEKLPVSKVEPIYKQLCGYLEARRCVYVCGDDHPLNK